eukprot:GHVL01002982.1.p1 GENE.GHVL01002982.1~~GHVL01002982.1.p1  ORF type:complete len:496 (-),score=71.10 GHVL01002982.1:90-1577(-)
MIYIIKLMRNICLLIYIYVVCTYAATASGPREDVANTKEGGIPEINFKQLVSSLKPLYSQPSDMTKEGGIPEINFEQLVSSLNILYSLPRDKCKVPLFGNLFQEVNSCYTLMSGDKGVKSFISLLKEVSENNWVFKDVDEMKRIMDLSTEYEELIMTDFLALSHLIPTQYFRGVTFDKIKNLRCLMIDAIKELEILLAYVRHPSSKVKEHKDKLLLWRAEEGIRWMEWNDLPFHPPLERSSFNSFTPEAKIENFNERYKNGLLIAENLQNNEINKQFHKWVQKFKKNTYSTDLYQRVTDLLAIRQLGDQDNFINPEPIWQRLKTTTSTLFFKENDYSETFKDLCETTLATIQMTAVIRAYGPQIKETADEEVRKQIERAEMSLTRTVKFLKSIRTFVLHPVPNFHNVSNGLNFEGKKDGFNWWERLKVELKNCGVIETFIDLYNLIKPDPSILLNNRMKPRNMERNKIMKELKKIRDLVMSDSVMVIIVYIYIYI